MLLLTLFAFLAGVVTILSPCILPILPVVLSGSVGTGKRKPYGIVAGFVLSFTFFTLFLSIIVQATGVSADILRNFSVLIIAFLGLSLLIPQTQVLLERFFTQLSALLSSKQVTQQSGGSGFSGGLLIGLSLGLIWTPCVGPILASVISLAISGSVSGAAVFITLAYSLGTALPMLAIIQGGRRLLNRVPWLLAHTAHIQKVFGVVMILTAMAIYWQVDRRFQTWILQTFPQYGVGLTKFEDNELVKQELKKVNQQPIDEKAIGKPMSDLTQPKGILASELIPGGQWFNTPPLKLADLRGKVVVIDFWTYSCINCQRSLPYVQSWWEKYRDHGLVIIGVHSPEFEFEKDPDNVVRAMSDFQLTYPIMQDNDFATWRAYDNHYWPAKYFIDKDGYIRYSHFGEGAYDESEKVIQQLLAEAGAPVAADQIFNPEYQVYAKTPETYLGYFRIDNFSSLQQIAKDVKTVYTAPVKIPANTFAYEGAWSVMPEYASPVKGARLYLSFEAKEVFLVARPKNGPAVIKVYLDNQLQAFGEDNVEGTVTVDADRLYKLINLPSPGRHLLKLEFEDENVEVYAFTFG